jgi:hypothetical protein
MDVTIASVANAGDDVLLILAAGVDADGNELVFSATGWVSATTNYFPPDQYGEDGHLIEGAAARAMTQAEIGDYALALVLEQNPQLQAVPTTMAPVDFEPPAPVTVDDATAT